MRTGNLQIDLRAVAPDYSATLVTIRSSDHESRWLVSLPATSDLLAKLIAQHNTENQILRIERAWSQSGSLLLQ